MYACVHLHGFACFVPECSIAPPAGGSEQPQQNFGLVSLDGVNAQWRVDQNDEKRLLLDVTMATQGVGKILVS